MELLVFESTVPATLCSLRCALGRNSYGPSVLIMEVVEEKVCTY